MLASARVMCESTSAAVRDEHDEAATTLARGTSARPGFVDEAGSDLDRECSPEPAVAWRWPACRIQSQRIRMAGTATQRVTELAPPRPLLLLLTRQRPRRAWARWEYNCRYSEGVGSTPSEASRYMPQRSVTPLS